MSQINDRRRAIDVINKDGVEHKEFIVCNLTTDSKLNETNIFDITKPRRVLAMLG